MISFSNLYNSTTGMIDLDIAKTITIENAGNFDASFTGRTKAVSETSALLTGKLKYSALTVCDRCFTEFTYISVNDIDIYIIFENAEIDDPVFDSGSNGDGWEESDLAGSHDNNDDDYYTVENERFDPWDVLNEEVMLSLPYQYLCSKTCQSGGDYITDVKANNIITKELNPFNKLGDMFDDKGDN